MTFSKARRLNEYIQSDPRFISTLRQIMKTPEKGGLTSNVRLLDRCNFR